MRVLAIAIVAGCGFAPRAGHTDDGGIVDGGPCVAASFECVTADMLRSCSGVGATYVDTPCVWGCLDTGGAHCAQFTPMAGAVGNGDMLDFSGLADTTLTAGLVMNSKTGEIGTVASPTSIRGSGPGIDHGILFEPRTDVALFKFQTLKVEGSLALIGTRAIALVADNPITIDAVVDARGPCTNLGKTVGGAAGPGGFQGGPQTADASGSGGGSGGSNINTNGGGGGGHGGVGGSGGSGAVAGGPAFDPAFALLTGGGGGGGAGGGNGNTQPGGGGGGGVQLISNTRIEIGAAGGINAGGCGGFSTTGPDSGAGGGAGGTIILEAPIVRVVGALAVNGGGGGAGPTAAAAQGENGRLDRVAAAGAGGASGPGGNGGAAAQLDGLPGTTATKGGGGGAVGRMRINTKRDMGLDLDLGAVLSPSFMDAATTCTRGSASVQ